MTIIITGVAGFIGYHVARSLLAANHDVIGCDNLNSYYDIELKKARLERLSQRYPDFKFYKVDLASRHEIEQLFNLVAAPGAVIHLGAQAGVRYASKNPDAYIQSNLVGFANLLEVCRHKRPDHLLFASSSSVYGNTSKLPFNENMPTDKPLSLYAATKKANEAMAYSYANLYGMVITGMRFFTVYGPWGRPDMAPFIFTERIIKGLPINIFNNGHHKRDFTYIDDIVTAIIKLISSKPMGVDVSYQLVNIGNGQPVALLDFVRIIEQATDCTAITNFIDAQPGDVANTHADIYLLQSLTGYKAKVDTAEGMRRFVKWYRDYYNC